MFSNRLELHASVWLQHIAFESIWRGFVIIHDQFCPMRVRMRPEDHLIVELPKSSIQILWKNSPLIFDWVQVR